MKKVFVVLVLLIVAMGVWYGYKSYRTFVDSDYEAGGFLVCNKDNTYCENSQHIHAYLDLSSCGRDILFEKEKGRTDLQHTHKEQNRIHWHAREIVDPVTKEPVDKKPRQLLAFLEQMEYKIPASCTNSPQIKTTLYVTPKDGGEERIESLGLEYIWKDEEKLKLVIE